MAVSNQVTDALERSSWVRAMFEVGRKLKAEHGADNGHEDGQRQSIILQRARGEADEGEGDEQRHQWPQDHSQHDGDLVQQGNPFDLADPHHQAAEESAGEEKPSQGAGNHRPAIGRFGGISPMARYENTVGIAPQK